MYGKISSLIESPENVNSEKEKRRNAIEEVFKKYCKQHRPEVRWATEDEVEFDDYDSWVYVSASITEDVTLYGLIYLFDPDMSELSSNGSVHNILYTDLVNLLYEVNKICRR